MTMTHALGWALVDSLWQDALAAAALAALCALVPVRAARLRYALATATLLLMVVFPVATAVRLTHEAPWTLEAETAAAVAAPSISNVSGAPVSPPSVTTAAGPIAERIRTSLAPLLPWVVLLWFAGVVTLSLRLASGWLVTRRLRSVGTDVVPDACLDAVARLAERLRVSRPVRVLQSAVVHVPAVVGWLRPAILLPASALTGLTPLQLDALLAHELAHIRRYDYVVNLVQAVIETLLFYHPAVWWVSRTVREEREHCCDDLAVRVCGDPHFYATALVGMERLRGSAPAFAMAATGGGGSLMTRVRRLVAPAQTEFPRWMAGVVAVSLALAGGAHLASGASQSSGLSPAGSAMLARVERVSDPDARRELVKRMGRSGDARALATLIAIARTDADEDVQREAVESLGKLNDGAGIAAVLDIARTHPNTEIRRRAVKTIGEVVPAQTALGVLNGMAERDGDHRVQQEAVEELGHLRSTQALPSLKRFARVHPNGAVREEALEQYAKHAAPEAALALLEERLAQDSADDVQIEAIERLAELPDGLGRATLAEAARAHPNAKVRAEARQRLSRRF